MKKYNIRRGLSNKESFLLSTLARKDKPIFSINDARKVLKGDVRKTLSSLKEKKWILPLKRGLYVIVPLEIGIEGSEALILHNFVIASHLVKPYYIGYWSALNHHGLTDQIPSTTFIATKKPKNPLEILGNEFYFVTLVEHKFFGFETEKINENEVLISDKNKTIVDSLDHPEYVGGIENVAKAIFFYHEELDFEKVREYGIRMKNFTIFKRLGHILDVSGLSEKYENVLKGVKLLKGFSLLDPLSPRKGKYSRKWGLLINVELKPERWMY